MSATRRHAKQPAVFSSVLFDMGDVEWRVVERRKPAQSNRPRGGGGRKNATGGRRVAKQQRHGIRNNAGAEKKDEVIQTDLQLSLPQGKGSGDKLVAIKMPHGGNLAASIYSALCEINPVYRLMDRSLIRFVVQFPDHNMCIKHQDGLKLLVGNGHKEEHATSIFTTLDNTGEIAKLVRIARSQKRIILVRPIAGNIAAAAAASAPAASNAVGANSDAPPPWMNLANLGLSDDKVITVFDNASSGKPSRINLCVPGAPIDGVDAGSVSQIQTAASRLRRVLKSHGGRGHVAISTTTSAAIRATEAVLKAFGITDDKTVNNIANVSSIMMGLICSASEAIRNALLQDVPRENGAFNPVWVRLKVLALLTGSRVQILTHGGTESAPFAKEFALLSDCTKNAEQRTITITAEHECLLTLLPGFTPSPMEVAHLFDAAVEAGTPLELAIRRLAEAAISAGIDRPLEDVVASLRAVNSTVISAMGETELVQIGGHTASEPTRCWRGDFPCADKRKAAKDAAAAKAAAKAAKAQPPTSPEMQQQLEQSRAELAEARARITHLETIVLQLQAAHAASQPAGAAAAAAPQMIELDSDGEGPPAAPADAAAAASRPGGYKAALLASAAEASARDRPRSRSRSRAPRSRSPGSNRSARAERARSFQSARAVFAGGGGTAPSSSASCAAAAAEAQH